MAFVAKALADLMFAYVDQSGTSGPSGDVTNATASDKASIALCMTQAAQEARKINPSLFARRVGTVLKPAASGTITVTQFDTAATLGTLVVPNDGCTVRIASGLDNELNLDPGGASYALRRPHEGASGSQTAQIWNDCWVVDDGTTYGGVLGTVTANGRPIEQVRSAEQLDRFRLINDYGVPTYARLRTQGIIAAVMCEQWASPFVKKVQTRLRFAPMPASLTSIEADLVIAAPRFSSADILSTSITFQIPQQIDELLLFPLAMKRMMAQPTFRAPKETRAELEEQYRGAVETLKNLRGHYGGSARIDVRG
ncbi:MAG: hypothetical protein ABJF10_21300 [Chthoniobacter sp.]|uniref:hypothetical protein n=1 Tax=Chthoniobacter sp. TaxID=2510640 RepID=UPI0032A55BF1